MSEEKKIVRVKLIKHEWPDERAARHKRQKNIMLTILLCGGFFVGGFGTASLTRPATNSGQTVDSKYSVIHEIMSDLWYFGKDMPELDQTLMHGAISGMVQSGGDKHTQYMDPETAEKFMSSMEGDLVGIGVQYTSALEQARIFRVFPNSPAEKGGLLPNDVIVQVDDLDVTQLEDKDLSKYVRGEEGSHVKITVERKEERLTFDIVRASFDSSVYAYVKEGVGILEINTFGEHTADTVGIYLNQMKEQGIDCLIVDLRNNTGGYLTTTVDIGSYLFENDALILQEETRDGHIAQYRSKSSIETLSFDKIAVLINEQTASASEVLTAALKENLDAVVIGKNSYGKGTVQTSIPFSDGSVMKYTKAEWLTPNGNKINGIGIAPDYEIDLPKALAYGIPLTESAPVKMDTVSQECMLAQINLELLGYDVDRTDGYFSAATRSAIQKFQLDQGLTVSDELNFETLRQTSYEAFERWYLDRDELDFQMQKALEVIHGR